MFAKPNILLLIVISLCIVGCATGPQPYKPVFSRPDQSHLQEKVRVVSVVNQSDIKAQYIPTSTAGMVGAIAFGAGGALVGSALDGALNQQREVDAKEAAAPYRQMLEEFDAEKHIEDALKKALEHEGLHVTELVTDASGDDLAPADYTKDFNDEKVLIVETSYSFDPSLHMIHVVSNASLYLYQRAIRYDRGRATPIYEKRSWGVTIRRRRTWSR